MKRVRFTAIAAFVALLTATSGAMQAKRPPSVPLRFGGFVAEFGDEPFRIEGRGWPTFIGTWKVTGSEIELMLTEPLDDEDATDCDGPGRYGFEVVNRRMSFSLMADECFLRRTILDRSTWWLVDEPEPNPERRIEVTAAEKPGSLPKAAGAAGSWPSFRGPNASGIAEDQDLPDTWNGETGENIRWKIPIPGLAHSSPIVWGDRIFVTSAISSQADASFRPGLYGDGDASEDRSVHQWTIYALSSLKSSSLWQAVVAPSSLFSFCTLVLAVTLRSRTAPPKVTRSSGADSDEGHTCRHRCFTGGSFTC